MRYGWHFSGIHYRCTLYAQWLGSCLLFFLPYFKRKNLEEYIHILEKYLNYPYLIFSLVLYIWVKFSVDTDCLHCLKVPYHFLGMCLLCCIMVNRLFSVCFKEPMNVEGGWGCSFAMAWSYGYSKRSYDNWLWR